jgi:RimJ/RimL family protein N-acetyltransferase
MNIQPTHLQDANVTLLPLQPTDFEQMYQVANDPLIWEQHPSKTRYQREVFANYFKGAIESQGAFLILDTQTGEPIGSSRFYDYDAAEKSILIGYTFLARSHWGSTYNRSLKTLMIDHAFTFAEKVIFHIGAQNIRSQKAIEKLGAVKMGELDLAYYGEASNPNFIYQITKADWLIC